MGGETALPDSRCRIPGPPVRSGKQFSGAFNGVKIHH